MLPETREVVLEILDLAGRIRTYPEFNERYLHHALSARLQRKGMVLDPGAAREQLTLHPEWPTYKKATGIKFGRYGRVDGKYSPKPNGTTGWVDFTVGTY